MADIAVIGAGKWGSGLAFALSQNHQVVVTSRTPREVPNFVSLDVALAHEYLVIAIPAQHISGWLEEHFTFQGQKVLVAAKGIEATTGKFLNEIYNAHVPESHLCYLSGPSFAKEVMQGLPTALVINATNASLAKAYGAFFPDFIRTYVSTDVVGAEVAGAYKNVIAIAGGICEGLGLGKNAAAALISRGLVEMHRFGLAFGAEDDSFLGLSGAGDLFLTASSTMSRNFRVGLGLAAGKQTDAIVTELGETAEGIGTAYALEKIAMERDLYLPIAKEVYLILEGKDPEKSLNDLLTR